MLEDLDVTTIQSIYLAFDLGEKSNLHERDPCLIKKDHSSTPCGINKLDLHSDIFSLPL